MARDSDARDEITIEVVYLLAVLVAPILLAVFTATAAWWLFGLHAAVWTIVVKIVFALAAAVGVVLAVIVNREFRAIGRL
jgi:hypothetical protein